jgi:hypothetical protein
MVEIIHQTQNCLCDGCRFKRSQQFHRHGRRLNKKVPFRKGLPLEKTRGQSFICDVTRLDETRPSTPKAIAAIGNPALVPVNIYPEEVSHDVQHSMQFCEHFPRLKLYLG